MFTIEVDDELVDVAAACVVARYRRSAHRFVRLASREVRIPRAVRYRVNRRVLRQGMAWLRTAGPAVRQGRAWQGEALPGLARPISEAWQGNHGMARLCAEQRGVATSGTGSSARRNLAGLCTARQGNRGTGRAQGRAVRGNLERHLLRPALARDSGQGLAGPGFGKARNRELCSRHEQDGRSRRGCNCLGKDGLRRSDEAVGAARHGNRGQELQGQVWPGR